MNRSIFHLWHSNNNSLNTLKKIKSINLNFGPQHPAAHGVLRLILQLNGEIIDRLDPHIGLLHRGTEKLIEDRNYLLGLPYFDRLDYVSMLAQEHSYCLAIESLLETTNFSSKFSFVRSLFDEITRLLNHLLAIACHALDVGSMSSIFWAFEEREKLMEFYERVSGARMHAAFYRPNEINFNSLTFFLLEDILEFSRNFFSTLNEMHNVLTYNKIWKQRLINIGIYNYKDCLSSGLTGVMLRSCGIKRDLRLSRIDQYSSYYYLNFRSYIGQHGDCYDRFLIRMNEMSESINIINQIIQKFFFFNLDSNLKKKISNKFLLNFFNNFNEENKNKTNYTTMEKLIDHFKYWNENLIIKKNITYQAIESPKGEFGVTLISNNSTKPFKCKIRSPSYHHLQFLSNISKGHFLADLATLIGTIDIVFGEIDR